MRIGAHSKMISFLAKFFMNEIYMNMRKSQLRGSEQIDLCHIEGNSADNVIDTV